MARDGDNSRRVWSRRIARWKRSSLTLDAFSEGEGISAAQLKRWIVRLRALETDRAAPASFVELTAASSGLGVELVLHHGAVLRVPVGFDEATVVRLVRVLGGGAS